MKLFSGMVQMIFNIKGLKIGVSYFLTGVTFKGAYINLGIRTISAAPSQVPIDVSRKWYQSKSPWNVRQSSCGSSVGWGSDMLVYPMMSFMWCISVYVWFFELLDSLDIEKHYPSWLCRDHHKYRWFCWKSSLNPKKWDWAVK